MEGWEAIARSRFVRITTGMTYSTRASYKTPMGCPKANAVWSVDQYDVVAS